MGIALLHIKMNNSVTQKLRFPLVIPKDIQQSEAEDILAKKADSIYPVRRSVRVSRRSLTVQERTFKTSGITQENLQTLLSPLILFWC